MRTGLPRPARSAAAWCLVDGAFVVCVAKAAISALEEQDLFAFGCEVMQNRVFVFINDLRANRNADDAIFAMGASAVVAFTVFAVFGSEVLLIAEVDQRVHAVVGNKIDIAAFAAIAAIWAAKFHVLFAAEADASRAAMSAL